MTFPQYNNKHLEKALFDPEDFIDYKKWGSKNFPKKIVITYQTSAYNHFRRKYGKKCKVFKFTGLHKVFKYGDVGFIKMTGIGAPHAIVIFEELIALGAKEFLNIGTAGGLQEEGIYVCDRAIRDEGTSHHYAQNGQYSYPDKKLTGRLVKTLKAKGLPFTIGTTWTVDAPYRETKTEVEHYRKEGVSTVEMEASALFTVAKLRKVKIASAFVVSDVLGKKWTPKFHTFNVKRALSKLIDSAVETLGGKR